MKSASLSNQMTLLVLRDANQPVKQVRVSKPLIVAVPMVALLSISGLIVSMHINSNRTITQLEGQLQQQSIQFEAVVTDRDEAIQRLQNEVVTLSGQSKGMMDRMEKVVELEAELQEFINKYGKQGDLSNLSALSLDDTDSLGIGGEYIAVHDNEIDDLAKETGDDLREMNAMLDEMEKNVPVTLIRATQTQYSLTGNPSEWPTPSKRLTSSFGYRTDPFTGKAAFHSGIDISGKIGDPVYAAGAGQVLTTDRDSSHGKYIVIQHPDGLESWYLHLSDIDVSAGDIVTKGQTIGKVGNTGRSTGSHLHFEIVKQNKPIDPMPFLKQ